MKRINEIGVYKSGNLRLEVVDLKDLKETVDEKTAVFVGHTTVTSRIGGEDFSASYQISREYLRQRAQWHMVKSQRAPWRTA
jgi:hypothetical protein